MSWRLPGPVEGLHISRNTFEMAHLNKGILFGSIRNWSNGESKICLKFNGKEGVKRRRQFVLEDVAGWHLVGAFGEEGAEALRNACRRIQVLKKDSNANGSWDHDITQKKREGREEEEMIKEVDEASAKSAIEILNASIAMQDPASYKEVKGVDILYLTKVERDRTLERIIIRIKDNDGALVTGVEYTWNLTTPRSKSKRQKRPTGTLVQQLVSLERRLAGVMEEGSDNETIVKKTVKKGKRVLRKDGTSLSQLEEEVGLEYVELAVPRPFEEVRTNMFETAPPSWKLDNSQKGWNQKEKKGTMEWEVGE